jgi:creatinine amidohydrolase
LSIEEEILPLIAEWDLTQTNLHRLQQINIEVAVLPIGSLEPHNLHLPQGQDTLHTTAVAKRCCCRAWEKTRSVICLPTIPYGVDCNLMDFPLAIHVTQATLDSLIRDIASSLQKHNIHKLVLLNGHGGNDFIPMIRQIQCDLDIHCFVCDWWKVGFDRYNTIFSKPDDHGGEFETSVALALYPDLVDLKQAKDGRIRPFKFEALRKGWIKTSRRFKRLNDHCGVGNPSKASKKKGDEYLDLVCGRISEFLIQLAESPLDEYFPQKGEFTHE